MIHFESFFKVWGLDGGMCRCVQLFQHHFLKMIYPLCWIAFASLPIWVEHICLGLFLGSSFHSIDLCSPLSTNGKLYPPLTANCIWKAFILDRWSFPLTHLIILAILGPIPFHINFGINLRLPLVTPGKAETPTLRDRKLLLGLSPLFLLVEEGILQSVGTLARLGAYSCRMTPPYVEQRELFSLFCFAFYFLKFYRNIVDI